MVSCVSYYADPDDYNYQEHQTKALSAGGFQAMADIMSLPGIHSQDAQGQQYRLVMLQAVCMIGTAFHFSPWQLDSSMLDSLISLVCKLVEGEQLVKWR